MRKVFLTFVGVMSSLLLSAQAVALPYEFGFEDDEAAELANWHLNPGRNAATDADLDEWIVGSAIRSAGQKALYITNDGGQSCAAGHANGHQIIQYAYRDFILPDGNYYISFDYICPDMTLYAGLTRYVDAPTTALQQAMVQTIDGTALPSTLAGQTTHMMSPAATWDNYTLTLRGYQNVAAPSQRYVRLFFVWVNSEADSVQSGISAAIDNIQIASADCQIPNFFEGDVEDCDHVKFTWDPTGAARYQIQYRPVGNEHWSNRSVPTGESEYTFSGMKEGNYDFRLRGICYVDNEDGTTDTIYSPYTYLSNFNVFCPELHCIRYADIHDPSAAVCTYGKTSSSGTMAQNVDAAYTTTGVIDFGWDAKSSRHTVIWDTTAIDPRTVGANGGGLLMVRPGDGVSVRLGNWDTGQGAEAITYTYDVDVDNSILLVNYAIVLEDPSSHDADEMPRFLIRILDENDQLIDPTCGVIDLNPLTNKSSFQSVSGSSSSYGDGVVYKDWTTLGLNLDAYVGRTIKISVATFDCTLSAHYGYAYFTMNCATARIKNTSCGADGDLAMTVKAPEGFLYSWHPEGSTQIRSTERTISLSKDDPTNWVCTLTSTENANCSFDLFVNTTARFPQAEFSLERDSTAKCENRYIVHNTSYIWTNEDGVREDLRDEYCDEFEWDGGIGDEGITSETEPVLTFPQEGGTFNVKLAAMIGRGEGLCRSEVVVPVTVPHIGDTQERRYETICEGSWVEFHGERYDMPGAYEFLGRNEYGCISYDSLYLTVNPKSPTIIRDTTLCYGDFVSLCDTCEKRDHTGVLAETFPNILGCDSSVILNVTVLPEIAFDIDRQQIDDEHEYASFTVTLPTDGSATYYTYEGQKYYENKTFGELDGGEYDVVFYNDFGCASPQVVSLTPGCMRDLIYQRWDDILSLKNAANRSTRLKYKGVPYSELVFTAFQWYKDGQPVEGATKSYLVQPGGLTVGAEYTCAITMADGTTDMSCGFTVASANNVVAVTPTYLPAGGTVSISVPEDCACGIYTSSGLKICSANLKAGDNYLQFPLSQGVYILQVQMEETSRPFRLTIQ